MIRITRPRAIALLTAVLLLGGLMLRWPRAVQPQARAEEPAKVVEVEMNVQEKTINVLGVPQTAWTFNGTIPGPTVRLHYGDILKVTLHNTHNLPHTLHTHFMDYNMTDDGSSATAPFPFVPHQNDDVVAGVGGTVPGISNQPGPKIGANPVGPYEPREDEDYARPGQSKTYTWEMLDVGTFWYHCHVMEATNHISKGLFGAFVVYPKGWTWEEDPPDPLNGNTKATLTNAKGSQIREDVVIMSEKNHADDSLVGLAAAGGAAGGIGLANFRAWNDPYLMGPLLPGQKGLIHVANIGETGKSWHIHGHHWYRLQQTWHPWEGYQEWHQLNDKEKHPSGYPAAPFDPVPFTPVMELAHTRWISSGEIMPISIKAGKPGMWFGHDHVVPQAYLGMIPWLVVKYPATSPKAAEQEHQLQQLQAEHLRYVNDPNAKIDPNSPAMTLHKGHMPAMAQAGAAGGQTQPAGHQH